FRRNQALVYGVSVSRALRERRVRSDGPGARGGGARSGSSGVVTVGLARGRVFVGPFGDHGALPSLWLEYVHPPRGREPRRRRSRDDPAVLGLYHGVVGRLFQPRSTAQRIGLYP